MPVRLLCGIRRLDILFEQGPGSKMLPDAMVPKKSSLNALAILLTSRIVKFTENEKRHNVENRLRLVNEPRNHANRVLAGNPAWRRQNLKGIYSKTILFIRASLVSFVVSCSLLPLGADKMGHCELEVHFIKTYYKQFFLTK